MLGVKLSHISSGLVAVIVGYSSSAVIIFQAATAAGATEAEISSWFWALGIGMGVSCIGLSLCYRVPLLTAWSTPGAALLVTSLEGVSLPQAVGAFLFCSLLIALCGVTGWFEKLIHRIPSSLASAMLAGVLLQFGIGAFEALRLQWLLVFGMLTAYLVARIAMANFAVPITLLTGIALAAGLAPLDLSAVTWQITRPVWVMPTFNWTAMIGVGLPLFIVTMTSQNVPAIAVLKAHGYRVSSSPLLSWTGVAGLLLAPFGGFTFNLAAITAAICMGDEVDSRPDHRYKAAICAGVFYLILGVFGASVVALFTAFPEALVMAIAGLALLKTLESSFVGLLGDELHREAALLTFLMTASGVNFFSVSSAFWGLLLGAVAIALSKFKHQVT